jgi:hypothetical protein
MNLNIPQASDGADVQLKRKPTLDDQPPTGSRWWRAPSRQKGLDGHQDNSRMASIRLVSLGNWGGRDGSSARGLRTSG